MINIVGKPVEGENYFPRKNIEKQMYRRLDTGAHVLLSAPRRVGKTSFMWHLMKNPRDKYIFLYLNAESVMDSEEYFKLLFDNLLKSEAVAQSVKRSQSAKSIFERITERVKKIELFGVGLELQGSQKGKYSDEFYELMNKLDTDEFSIVMMVDEFPSAVENIREKQGELEAVIFLKLNRTMRQTATNGLQFIYTGSIGLPALVSRLNVPESINDLNQLEMPELTKEEAIAFTEVLLKGANVSYEPDALEYFIERVRWLMPFFIQIGVQELIEEFEINDKIVNRAAVDVAFSKVTNRRNNIHFETYYNRLKDSYPEPEYAIAVQILSTVASVEQLPATAIFIGISNEEHKRQVRYVLESLEYDGYIARTNGDFRFNSPILQLWWNKYVPNSAQQ